MRPYKSFLRDLKKSHSFLFVYMDCIVPIPHDFHQNVAAATYFAASENRPVFVIPCESKKGLNDYHPEITNLWTVLDPGIAKEPAEIATLVSERASMPLDHITLGIGGSSYQGSVMDLASRICSTVYESKDSETYSPLISKVNQGIIIPELRIGLK